MRTAIYATTLVLMLGSCGKKSETGAAKTDDKPATTPATAPARDTPTPPAAAPAGTLSCAKLVPQPIVDKHLSGFTLKEADAPLGGHQCNYVRDATTVAVTINCSEADRRDKEIALMKRSMHGVEVPGVGRSTLKLQSAFTQYDVWDDDTECHILVTAGDALADPLAFTKDIVQAITPAAIQ